MSVGVPTNCARRTQSFTTAELNDVDGVKQSIATATSAQEYTGVALNGAYLQSNTSLNLPRRVTLTSSSSAGSYNTTDPHVVTGTRAGAVVTENLTLTDGDGNETIRGTQIFDTITSLGTPEHNDTNGALSWGVGDVCAHQGMGIALKPHASGYLHVEYSDSSNDDIPVTSGVYENIAATAVLSDQTLTNPTDAGFTCYLLG